MVTGSFSVLPSEMVRALRVDHVEDDSPQILSQNRNLIPAVVVEVADYDTPGPRVRCCIPRCTFRP